MSEGGDALAQRYFGVYLGTVRAVDDPDGLGRVRLETDQYDDTDDDTTWATITRPLAGDKLSVFFTPREGDQVVLSYLGGDVRQPIVLGYAHGDRKPDGVTATKHAIEISGVGRIVFDEANEKIVLEHAGGGSITLSAGKIEIEADNVCVNGKRVMLEDFLQVFDGHTHEVASAVAGPQVVPTQRGTPNTTNCT